MTRANPLGRREADLQRQVVDLAGLRGWWWYHTHDSRRSPAGFPDLVLLRARRLIFAELKSPTGKLRPEQHRWMLGLSALAGMPRHPKGAELEAYVWTPDDWPAIERVLA